MEVVKSDIKGQAQDFIQLQDRGRQPSKMMEVQTLDAQLRNQQRQDRIEVAMGNRNVEITILPTPCQSHALIISRLQKPDHTIELVAD